SWSRFNRSSPEAILWGYDISPQAIELAKNRANERLHSRLGDFSDVKNAYFELILVLDVIEHLQDYFGFLCDLKENGRHKIFHIPLDLPVQTVGRKHALLKRRDMYGHLQDRKSTRLNSSHVAISYAVFCLKKKK